eukprot:1161994-Pelagomonas_calceolata.AAC.7
MALAFCSSEARQELHRSALITVVVCCITLTQKCQHPWLMCKRILTLILQVIVTHASYDPEAPEPIARVHIQAKHDANRMLHAPCKPTFRMQSRQQQLLPRVPLYVSD